MDLREPIEGQHILIVEDIVDTGHTLGYLLNILEGRNPASLHTCALVRSSATLRQHQLTTWGSKFQMCGWSVTVWIMQTFIGHCRM